MKSVKRKPRLKEIPTTVKNKGLVKKRREQIFDAVIKLFSQKGYHTTTLREISKETGITLGNLYDYITSKEDILYIIQEKASQTVIEALSKANIGHLNPIEKLRRLTELEFEVVNKYQELIMIIYQESHAMRKEILYSLLRSERKHIQQYEKVIEEGIKKGFFVPTNIRMAANMIKMIIDGWVIKRWDLRGEVSLKEMKQGILNAVFSGVIKTQSNLQRSFEEEKS